MGKSEKISLDGRLDEAAWERAIPATDFVQQDPLFGEPATEHTEVRFLLDEHSLYMGVSCYDSEPGKLLGNQMLRDGFLSADDRFMWVFDPYLNGRNGYFFEMNPSGAMGDSLLGGSTDGRAWDGIWNARVRKTEKGWFIEIEMPFRTLNFDPDAPAWGVNFQRTVRRKNEESMWTSLSRNQNLRSLASAGLLTGVSEASQGLGLDVRPYFLGTFGETPGQNIPPALKGTVGADIFYSVTPQLRANVTLNTDFAETEVDQRRVNLTQFPLYYPEKRAFFLEGSESFDFARWPGDNTVLPFFSRRIGLDANGNNPQRIEYGAKLTGQAGAFDLGLLEVRTAPRDDLVGEEFTVLRTRRRFLRESYVGGLFTRRAPRSGPLPARQTLGADFLLGTSHFHGNQNLQLSGFYLWNTHDDLPDKGGASYGVRLDYPNDKWNVRGGFREVQDAYDPAVGFWDRRGFRRWDLISSYSPRPENSDLVRRYSFGANVFITADLQNRLLTREIDLKVFQVQFQSGDDFQVHVSPFYDRLATDFDIYPTVRIPAGQANNFNRYWMELKTADRRSVSLFAHYELGTFYSGTRRQINLGLGIRPRPGVFISLNNEWNRVELKEGRFSTAVPRVTVNTQFGPWISVANNVQYDTISRVLGWQSRFRWIVHPGDDVFVVYAHDWISDLNGRRTYDRGLATKVAYTHRF